MMAHSFSINLNDNKDTSANITILHYEIKLNLNNTLRGYLEKCSIL